MTWSILLALIIVIGIMSLTGRQQVPWVNKMRRMNPGNVQRAEWMAPEYVIQAVKSDYLTATRWILNSVTDPWAQQWSAAPFYLSGLYLKRHQEILKHYRVGRPLQHVGILRCVQDVTVRNFSEDGERCLVIDHQTERRMATYHVQTQERLNTQDLGKGSYVYEMVYDRQAKRWKIDRYIQQLPIGWHSRGRSKRLRTLVTLPPVIGRDN
ncbi:MAG: hypothetical protein ACOCX5_02500 [Chloroflexota bacterium]